ncbi:MAG: trypsin-like peptidase domain-containing protein [Dehalococcoidia bacterium]|nr:trypsin-like peptidase domain-containing protein [Dehalococcoidia bacterium]
MVNWTRRFPPLMLVLLLSLIVVGCTIRLPDISLTPGQPTQEATTAPTTGQTSQESPPPQGIAPLEDVVIKVNKEASPGVVNISTTLVSTDIFLQPSSEQATGSGFVIDQQGNIVTNNHVVEGAEKLEVTFADGSTAEAKLVGRDPSNDLAVIKVDVPAGTLHPLKLGDSNNLQVGQMAIAIGSPFRLQGTVTMGVISSLGRDLRAGNGRVIGGVVQTDAAINPGNSGGPLLNSVGEVIGVNSAIFSPTGGNVGIGFAIPVNTVKRWVPELISQGRARHPYLGITGQTIDPALAKSLNLPVQNGVLLAQVSQGTPAAKAGLQGGDRQTRVGNVRVTTGGDIITTINGTKLKKIEDLTNYLDTKTNVGDQVTLTVVRGNQTLTITVTLAERPSDSQ